MPEFIEIRWHGRGGQGAVTAAKIFAEAALSEGKHIQAFPEYGPERTGAPVRSFTRISSDPIRIHCQVLNPDIVVVLDPTLLDAVDVTEGLKDGGSILVNSDKPVDKIREKIGLKNGKVHVLDATKISLEKLGRNIPNTPMIGGLVKVSELIKLDTILEDFRNKFSKKFKKEILEGNIEAMKTAYEEVTSNG